MSLLTLLFLTFFFLNLMSSHNLCVKHSPITSSTYWDGIWNETGVYFYKPSYTRNVPGNELYLYYFDYECPEDLPISSECWCFNTASPGKNTYCSVYGDAANTTTPDEVDKWYAYNYPYDNDSYSSFTVSETNDTCLDIEDVGSCWHQHGSSDFGGHYRPQDNKIWWNQHQYKAKKDEFGIYYTYDLFIDTAAGVCSTQLLEDAGVDYCWCLSYYAADDSGNSCNYQSPVESYMTKPNKGIWYDFNYNEANIKFKTCDSDSNSGKNLYALFVLLLIPCGICLCCYISMKKRKQRNAQLYSQPVAYQTMPVQQNQQFNQAPQQPYGQVQYYEGGNNTQQTTQGHN